MPQPTRAQKARIANCEKARKKKQMRLKIEKVEFVIAVLLSGLTFQTVIEFLTNLGRSDLTIEEKDYYSIQKGIIKILNVIGKMNCKKWQEAMKPGAIIGIDGSWDHRRNGKFCIVEAFDLETKKIIAYSIIERPTQKNPHASFKSAANQMEIEGVKNIISELKPLNKIVGYVHDKDAKTTKLIAQLWNITEFIDPNHANKSFHKKFNKFNSGKTKYCTKKSLTGLEKKLSNFKTILAFSNFSKEEREMLWLNAVEHFKKNHTSCIHLPYPNVSFEKKKLGNWAKNVTKSKENALDNFLRKTIPYVTKIDGRYTSQLNECFHSVKTILANKNKAWGESWIARMAIAVLRFNEPDSYIFMIRSILKLPMFATSITHVIRTIANTKRRKRIYSHNKRGKTNMLRKKARRQQRRDDNNPNAGYRF